MKTQIKFYTLSLLLSSSTLIAMEDDQNQEDTEIETQEEYQDIYKFLELMKEIDPVDKKFKDEKLYKRDKFLDAAYSLFESLNNSNGTSSQLNIIIKIMKNHLKSINNPQEIFENIDLGYNINKIDKDKLTNQELIIFEAKTSEYMNFIKLLHDHGRKIDLLPGIAASENRIDWIDFSILKLGLNVNTINFDHSPLTLATEQNNYEAVEKLIELGADVNWGNHKPLKTSVSNKNLKITKLLLKHGATIKDEPKKLTTDKQDINSNKTEKKVTGLILRGSAKKVIDPEKIVDPKKQKSKELLEFENW